MELYVPRSGATAADGLARRAQLGAEELTREGTPVRCARSIFVPEDETCFLLFEAASADDVRAAAERARLPVGHVTQAFAGSVRKEDEP